jgi:hypothetical protein
MGNEFFHGEPLPHDPISLAERLGLPSREVAVTQAVEAGKSLRGDTEQIAIRMPRLDLERARRLAEKKGMPYQTLIKSLLHEALERAEVAGG